MSVKTKGALLWEAGNDWSVEEIDVGDPREGEVTVELAATGLCHSDEHLVTGGTVPAFYPVLGGHEGSGVVTAVGPGVQGLQEGDHVVTAFIPACGHCLPCSKGMQNLCDLGKDLVTGRSIADGTARVQAGGRDVVSFCLLGTFAPYMTVHQASVVKIHPWIPLEVAALVGCGVTTGWGSSVKVGDVRPGETVVVMGTGGVGMNAVQGAVAAGAQRVITIDPVARKGEWAKEFGATHTFTDAAAAKAAVTELTWGRMADKAIVCIGHLRGEDIQTAVGMVGKGGRVVVVGLGDGHDRDVKLGLMELTLFQKDLQGAIFGGYSPRVAIPELLDLYQEGTLKLDELVTRRYALEEINQGYQDMRDGKNIRGMVVYTDADR